MANEIQILVHSENEVLQEITLVNGQTTTLKAQDNVTYELKNTDTNAAPEELVTKRNGNNLELYTDPNATTPVAVIDSYYLLATPSPLVGLAENGEFYAFVPQSGEASQLPWNLEDGDSSYQSLGYDTQGSAVPWWPILLAGLLLIGGAVAASSSSSSGGGGAKPAAKPDKPTVDEITNNYDKDGNITDTTITGEAKPGDKVIITDESGKIVGEGSTDGNGEFEVTVPGGLEDGKDYDVVVDKDGNKSDPETITGDTTAPDKPIIDKTTNNSDGSTTIKGEAEADSKVEITDENGNVIGEGTADENGKFEITVHDGLEDGKDYDITAKDEHNNTSDPETVTGDTTPPSIDNIESKQLDTSNPADGKANQTQVIFESDDPNAEFIVTGPNGETPQDIQLAADGKWVATFEPPLTPGGEFTITGTDAFGNTASATDTVTGNIEYVGGDNEGPEITDVIVEQWDTDNPADGNANETRVSFKADDPNATYTVTGPNGEAATVTDNGDGTYSAVFQPALNAGDEVTVRGEDPAGNDTEVTKTVPSDMQFEDTEGPEITDVTVEQWDTNNPADGNADETRVTFTANDSTATYTVTGPNGKIATVTDNGDGTYSAVFQPALNAGDEVIVKGVDLAGNETEEIGTVPADILFDDEDAPAIPIIETGDITNNYDADNKLTGTTVKGKVEDQDGNPEQGATVEITDENGNVIGAGTTDNNGNFEVIIEPALDEGKTYEVVAKDKAGNESDPETITGDTTAPAQPSAILIGDAPHDAWITKDEINADDTIKVVVELPATGVEAGDILVVNGIEQTITQADIDNGKIELKLEAPNEGEKLNVDAYIKDDYNNPSNTVSESATVDTLAPEKPIIDSIDVNGDVTGHTEPGATITDKNGNPLQDATGEEIKADSNGKFDIPAGSRPADEIIKAQDPAGNLSDETNILTPPPIENAIDRVESIENGVIKDHTDLANFDRIANNGFTNDAQPLFEIPASMAGSVNENILIINGQIVEAEKVDQGDGKTYLRPVDSLNEAPHDVSYTTDQSVDLTTDPTTLDQDALSDAFTLTVDTTAPGKPIVDETTNNFDANGDTESTTITGKAEPGSKVEITDENGVLVGEGTADNKGDFVITVEPALEDGKDYDVVAKDEAGNTSEPETITGDTTAPDAPESISIGNGDDNWINADEATGGKVNVTVKLPSTNVSVGDVLVVNGEKHVITQADLDANEVILEVDVPNEGDTLHVDAYLEDAKGNRSNAISNNATVDTTPPTVEAKQESPTEIKVTSDEAGEIKIIGADGVIIGTGVAQQDGTVSVTLSRPVGQNEEIIIEVTDEAGNTGNDTFNAVRSDTHAVENHEELVLNAVAKEVNMDGLPGSLVGQKAINFGVASAGLGGVADAGVLDFDNLINATVDEGTERKLKLFADGGGISIGQVFDLIVLKEDEYGNWKFYQVYEDWFTIPFLGYVQDGSITLNDPGNYAVFLSGKAGIGVLAGAGLEVTGDTVFDYNNPESVSGEISGNVLTDVNNFGSEFGQDIYDKENTTVTKVTFDGVEYDVPSNGILTIDAEHGTLTIDPTGKYTYEVKDGALPAYGTTEKFTYTITNGVTGDSSSADLTIELVQNPSNVLPSANDTLWLDPATEEIPIDDGDKLTSKSWSEIAGVGLGIADVSAVIIENGMDITVGENQVRDISFSGVGGAPVAIGYTPVTFAIYKLEHTEHGDFWQLYTVQEDWWGIVGVVVGAGQSSENINVRLDEGQYKAVLIPNTAGIAVIPTVTLKVESDTLYEHKATNNELSGEVDLGGFELYGVDGVLKGNASDITVQGEYGTLVINSDGSYTYTLKSNFDSKNIGAVETFSYSMKDPVTGQLKTSTLNITINSVQTEDDFDRAGFGMDNIESYEGWSVDTRTSVSNSTKTYAKDINVGENQIFDLTFDYNLNQVGTLLGGADQYIVRLIDADTGVVIETHLDVKGSKGEKGSWQLHLPEGNYRIEVIVDPRAANQQNVKFNLSGTITSLDDFRTEADNHDPADGNLLDNDGYEQYGQIEVNGKPLAIITDDKFNNNPVKSVTVEGEHGTLTVHQDGSYTYKANGSSYGVDEFDYKLISINGTSESAKLSINVGMNITGSKYDDIITGSDGGDVLRYELLDNNDATGGNGTDTWTDFTLGDVALDVAADQIDLSKLLEGQDVDASNAADYLKVEHDASNNTLTLSIDRDGAGGTFDYEKLLVLENQTNAIDLDDLLNHQQIIF